MADFENEDLISGVAVPYDVRRDGGQFAPVTRDDPPPIGMYVQRVRSLPNAVRQPLGGQWIEFGDVGLNRYQFDQRATGPDYLNQWAGAGFSSGVPHVFSHSATSL